MQEWRTSTGLIAAALWVLILISGAFGCGITREVSLPNGYILYIDDFIWISHPEIDSVVVNEIEELDVQGDLVFGTRRAWLSDEFLGYFILETELQAVWETQDYEAWSEQLSELGVNEPDLRWPGINFNGFSIWSVVTPCAISVCVIIAVLWFIRQVAKHERQIRQDRLDRL